MTDLAMEPQISGTIRLYDIDREAAEANAIIGNRQKQREDVSGQWDYVVKDTLREALDGADFVVISILPGTFDEKLSKRLYREMRVYQRLPKRGKIS